MSTEVMDVTCSPDRYHFRLSSYSLRQTLPKSGHILGEHVTNSLALQPTLTVKTNDPDYGPARHPIHRLKNR